MTAKLRMSMVASVAFVALVGSAQAQQAPQSPNMTFFISSIGSGKGADLGGLAGADAHCQQLATAAGAGSKTWHAYLSTNQGAQGGPVNARDRIGKGPWQNFKGTVIATSVEDLHGDNNKLGNENTLTERGTMVAGFGMTPNWHDALTGSQMDGTAWPGNMNLTCNNWSTGAAARTPCSSAPGMRRICRAAAASPISSPLAATACSTASRSSAGLERA